MFKQQALLMVSGVNKDRWTDLVAITRTQCYYLPACAGVASQCYHTSGVACAGAVTTLGTAIDASAPCVHTYKSYNVS